MIDLGEGAGRTPFSLFDEEDEDVVAVALALVVLSQLTIIPSIPSDAVSRNWTLGGMGGGHLTPFAVSTRAISLALTNVPSLAYFPPFTGSSEGGGGGVK